MESVASDAVLLIIFIRNAVEIILGLYREIEGRVEHCHLLHSGQHLPHGLHTHDVAGYVQRSQIGQRTALLYHLGGDQHALFEMFSAVGKTVSHSRNLLKRTYHASLTVYQRIHHHPETLGVIGYGAFHYVFLSFAGIGKNALRQPNTFQKTLGHHCLGIYIYQLILKRRTATIEN